MDFPPCCPDGRVANPCAETVYRQRVDGFIRLAGAWTGWRIQGHALIGPHGLRFTPQTLRNAWYSYSLTDESDKRSHSAQLCLPL
jgi:hypothetical protein